MKNKIFKLLPAIVLTWFGLTTTNVSAQLTENFDVITTLPGAGWVQTNNSAPAGLNSWFQGNPTAFPAFNGATDSYIAANFNNTAGTGTISNWLITPNFTLKNGDQITFYTRTAIDNLYADNLQVRMSTNGVSSNVGATATSVGDFTTVLLDINPTLALSVYPLAWTQFTVVVSGLTAPTSGRLAFRYFVTNAGPTGLNSDYIGIDNFVYTPYVCPTLTVTPASLTDGTAGIAYASALSQTGALGTPSYTVTAGTLPPGVVLATNGTFSGTPSATGTYSFTVTVTDESGCTGSTAYSLTINCPTGGATLAPFTDVCIDAAPVVLTQGSPSGGTYSGTGVTGSSFDPSSGTQTITYSLTDVYGCPQSAMGTITVNALPTVTLGTFTAVCSDDAPVVLIGGTPAGGSYSGTGVTAGSFDPSSGTQNITYSYTDANSCSNSAVQSFPVNTSPSVALTPFTDACSNDSPIVLTGGSPAGGTYSGTGVAAGSFNPASGTQNITYSFTDVNGCSGSTMEPFTVNTAPTVTLSAFSDVCEGESSFALTGGSPVGGSYSGTNVTAGQFDPATAGTYTITYDYTDANGCSNSAISSLVVISCLGLNEVSGFETFSCYPNPSNGLVTVQFELTESTDISISIFSLEGKMVYNRQQSNLSGSVQTELDLTELENGIYLLEIEGSQGKVTQQIIIE